MANTIIRVSEHEYGLESDLPPTQRVVCVGFLGKRAFVQCTADARVEDIATAACAL